MVLHNPFSLKGKTILITGASSGIGRAIAIECSNMGAIVNIVGRDQKRLVDTFNDLQGKSHRLFFADLTSKKDIDNLVSGIDSLDGIVHAAGIIKRIPLKLITEEMYQNLLGINLIAPALLTRSLYKVNLIRPAASIVLISSIGSKIASLGNIMYMSSKGGLNSLMKGLALELASKGIRVNSIEPGMIKTNLTKLLPDEDLIKDINCYPLGRYGQPEEVAYATIYLLSDATKWMTGSILKIDGGLTLR
jgi:NAD(P)-dependent dehydrogenase (short-subunit alcohol dehydrogenase family)